MSCDCRYPAFRRLSILILFQYVSSSHIIFAPQDPLLFSLVLDIYIIIMQTRAESIKLYWVRDLDKASRMSRCTAVRCSSAGDRMRYRRGEPVGEYFETNVGERGSYFILHSMKYHQAS